jgi:hypothetical protein
MYLRFTVPGAVTRAGIAPGPFAVASDLAWRHHDAPVGHALRHELDWFNDHLPVPKGRQPFAVRAKGRWFKDGVCWFRAEARACISRMHVMAALIEDCGVPVTRQVSRSPGQILYRDPYQVVAKPDWHWRDPAPLPAAR